ncbi:unnamed protein product [Linum trigynum]|uniref:Protein TIC 100 n=1 Tax=Linum trigynum TaxID=586398 RepID=A0AAV2D568_9ROSI
MANDDGDYEYEQDEQQEQEGDNSDDENNEARSSDSDSESEYSEDDYTAVESADGTVSYVRPGDEIPESLNTPEINIPRFKALLDSKAMKKMEEEEDRDYVVWEDIWDFPPDRENWKEEDLQELWADAPVGMTKPGWDPALADEEDWKVVKEEMKEGRDPHIEPFYVPYRKPYPVIPDNHYDIQTPKGVIEELDRIEEFLTWVSYVFEDGSTYEGTVWDDLAHGKGVYVAEEGLVRYEGEWLQNDMEGHGVCEVDIPDIEPVPGSKLEEKMRAEGQIIGRDFMSPEDRKWLEMDVEDSMQLAGGQYEIPFYENEEWIKQFGKKPDKGRYRYAGQWKHGRMHGCGVYELNERILYGRFYFGEFVEEATDCTEEISGMHAGIAEVAAAKARMFVNKPDGMVREERGPFNDPQHPYFYEDEDVWMAPGFINQFYEVPDYWKRYVQDVDQEREMWLNSFYKSPLRLPMPAELEYWWSQDQKPEFVVLSKEPETDSKDPSKLIYTENPVILHTPTGRIINFVEDEEHGIRMFWQPADGEDADPSKLQYLPLGFDEFYGKENDEQKETKQQRVLASVENAAKQMIDNLDKWAEEKTKDYEMKKKLIEKELELSEAEILLEDAIDSIDEDLELEEIEEEEEEEVGNEKEPVDEAEKAEVVSEDKVSYERKDISPLSKQDKEPLTDDDGEVEDEVEDEEEEDDAPPSSFGFVTQSDEPKQNGQKGNGPGRSPFSTASLLFTSCSLLSTVPSRLQNTFVGRSDRKLQVQPRNPCSHSREPSSRPSKMVRFPLVLGEKAKLRANKKPASEKFGSRNRSMRTASSQLLSLSRILSRNSPPATEEGTSSKMQRGEQRHSWLHAAPETDSDCILSIHTRFSFPESYSTTVATSPVVGEPPCSTMT